MQNQLGLFVSVSYTEVSIENLPESARLLFHQKCAQFHQAKQTLITLLNSYNKLDITLKVRDIEKCLQKFQNNFLKARSAQIMLDEIIKVA